MTRSRLRPIRTRRVIRTVPAPQDEACGKVPALTSGTRQTLAAIGALWVSFATSASAVASGSSLPPAPAAAHPEAL